MIINWKKENAGVLVVPCINSKGIVEKYIWLLPGHNDIPDKDWNAAKAHCESKIMTGLLDVVKEKRIVTKIVEKEVEKEVEGKNGKKKKEIVIEEEKIKTEMEAIKLKDLAAKTARKIVEDTWNLDTLKKWLNEDSRDEIRAVIHNQMEEVNKPPAKG